MSADTLTVKQSFPLDWKYSTDSQHFQSVGFTGSGIRAVMAGDSSALANVDSYVPLHQVSVVSLCYGLGVGTWMFVKVADHGWNQHDHLALSLSAGAGILLGGILQSLSGKHLRDAVEHYNSSRRTEPSEGLKVKVCLLPPPAHNASGDFAFNQTFTLGYSSIFNPAFGLRLSF